MKWTIDKSFSFAYGHRVWSQELNAEYTGSEGACLACRHLHGHEGLVKVHLGSDKLSSGMVSDFKHLGWFKDFLDDVLDHKFIMDINDPLLPHEVPDFVDSDGKLINTVWHNENDGFYQTLDLSRITWLRKDNTFSELAIIEKYEGMVFVDFVPTSENLAAWLLGIAQKKMADLDVTVTAVEYWETPKSHCKVEY